jgi:SAM-dependent methyltransferase
VRITRGRIVALDNYQPFLGVLMKNAEKEGLDKRIFPKNQSMLEMNFKDNSFDIFWSEGALYQMGFQNGLKKCYQLLKNGGYLAVTEGVLLTSHPSAEVKMFWEDYPDVKDVKANITLIQNENYHLLAHFTLPKLAWLDNYYSPMEKRIEELKKKYPNNKTALQVLRNSEKEIETYKANSDDIGYEFFIMQKR